MQMWSYKSAKFDASSFTEKGLKFATKKETRHEG